MSLTIDEYGRVLIPKNVRDAYGLSAGTSLKLEKMDDRIALVPVNLDEACSVDEDGMPIYHGDVETDAVSLVKRSRRDRTIGGKSDG